MSFSYGFLLFGPRRSQYISFTLSSNLATRAKLIPLDGFNPSRAVVYPSGEGPSTRGQEESSRRASRLASTQMG